MRFIKVHLFAAALFLIGGLSLSAHAADINYWRIPGRHVVSTSADGRDAVALQCAAKLSAPKGAYERFKAKIASGYIGPQITLADGMRFTDMTYTACRIWPNVQVAFGVNAPAEWRYAEKIDVLADDGSVVTYVRPYKCNNWSILAVVPPQRSRCFVVSFDHSQTDGVISETTAEYQAQDSQDWPSAAQAFLNPDISYTYVLAHLDLSDSEVADIQQDECFGVQDSTGFHQGVMYCERFCVRGKYPPPRFIREYAAEQNGVQLPEYEPQDSFQFPCAEGKCELHLPLRYASRFGMYCVAVARYHVSVTGYHSSTSNLRFDIVTSEEGARSLAAGKSVRGNIYLLNESGRRRFLNGALAY